MTPRADRRVVKMCESSLGARQTPSFADPSTPRLRSHPARSALTAPPRAFTAPPRRAITAARSSRPRPARDHRPAKIRWNGHFFSNTTGAPGPLWRTARAHSSSVRRRGPKAVGFAASASMRRVGVSGPKSSG